MAFNISVTLTQLYFICKIPDHQLLLSLALSTAAVQKELDLISSLLSASLANYDQGNANTLARLRAECFNSPLIGTLRS